MRNNILALASALVCCFPLWAGPGQGKRVSADNTVMDPLKGVMISGMQSQMCHVPSVVFGSDGMMYVSYYRDSTTTVEKISNAHTHTVLTRVDPSNPEAMQTFRHLGIGDGVGDFVQQDKAPYDPTLLALGDRIVYTFQSFENGERGYAASFFDVKSGAFEPRVQRCSLIYTDRKGRKVTVPLTDSGRVRCYKEAFGYKEPESPKDLGLCVLHSRYVLHNGEYYSVLSCDAPFNYAPLMVKTKDGVNFEVVFEMPEFNMGTCEVGQEFYKGEFYVIARTGQKFRDKKRHGVYIAKYSLDGECICAPRRISAEASRPTMLVHKNKLYAFFNTTPLVECSAAKKGVMRRSRMRVAMVTEDCHFSRYSDVTSPYSIQYYALCEHNGTIHVAYTEDRRLLNPNIGKGNISVNIIRLFR